MTAPAASDPAQTTAQSTDAAPDTGVDNAAEPEGQDEPDYRAETEKWKALARKHEATAKANAAAAKKLKEREDAELSEVERVQQKAAEAEQRAAAAEARAARSELAVEFALPAKWAARISGNTVEELRESAEALKADLDELRGEQQNGNGARPANFGQGARQTSKPPESADDFLRRAAGYQ